MNIGNCTRSNIKDCISINPRFLILTFLTVILLASVSFAQTATVTTDATDYPPGDSVVINGTGFMAGEFVEVVVTHFDGTPPVGDGHDPWLVTADGSGNFETFWIIPLDDNLDEVLLVTAEGQTSGEIAQTTFADANTITRVTQGFPSEVCLDTIDPNTTIELCAQLVEPCGQQVEVPLEGRTILFFVNAGNCGVNVGQVPLATAITDANGEACITVDRLDTLLAIGNFTLRPKFLGEEKPGANDDPNGACDPNQRTKLSASNDCVGFDVTEICDTPCEVVITCPVDANLSCEDDTTPTNTGTATFTSTGTDCGTLTIRYTDNVTAGSCANEYTISRLWEVVEDGTTVMASCTQTINVSDNTPPAFSTACPTDVTVQCDNIPTAPTMSATDNCGNVTLNYSETRTDGSCANNYTLTRVWTATDDCNNSTTCTQVITVEDTQAPAFVEALPADATVECDVVPDAAVLTATDNCTASINVTYSETRTDGACANAYTLDRTWTTTDECGNSVSYTQTVTVEDTQDPIFTSQCPADVTVACDNIPDPANMTASDNCAGVTMNFSEVRTDGNCINSYTLVRTWDAVDACGNTVTCSQTITVEDTQAPVFDLACPTDVTVDCNNIPTAPTMTATDNCTSNIVVNFSENTIPGNCANNYDIVRTWTATDDCGNTATCTQTVTVQDTEAPVFGQACPTDVVVECGAVPDAVTLTATDNCTSNIVVQFDEQTTAGQCANEYIVVRTWTATDECGNSETCTQTITVQDTQAAVFDQSCPADVTVSCDAVPDALTLTATDACVGAVNVVFSEVRTDGQCPDSYTLTRTWTADDGCGNIAECVQVVTVEDTTPPVFNEGCPTPVLTASCDAIPGYVELTATDNCAGDVEVTYSEIILKTPPVDCDYTYSIERHWTAVDNCGNTAECIQLVVISDTSPPDFVEACPTDVAVECGNIPDAAILTATDNCDPDINVIYEQIRTDGSCANEYTLTRTWTATDVCENTTVCTQIITVTDTTPPVSTIPDNFSIFMCQSEQVCRPISVTDNCDDNPAITIVSGPGEIINGEWCYTPTASETVNVTIHGEDDCGNFIESSFTAEFIFNSAPVVTCPDDQTFYLCDAETYCLPGFSVSDADGNLNNNNIVVTGGTLVGNTVCFDPVGGTHTITITATDDCGAVSSCTTTLDLEVNEAPSIVCPDPATLNWRFDTYSGQATATDPNSNETLTFSLSPGHPTGMTINTSTGLITWDPTSEDICTHTITVNVTDRCEVTTSCSFDICVTNTPPQMSCTGNVYTINWGNTVSGSVGTVSDPDNGPDNLFYSISSFDGPGIIDINTSTGAWDWTTYEENEYVGSFTLCINVSDGAPSCQECSPENDATCCISINVERPVNECPTRQIYIEKTHASLQGQIEHISLYQDSSIIGSFNMGGYNFLIQYDQSVLQFISAVPGKMLDDCGWEYFSYSYGYNGNCGDNACPSGIVRIVAIAEMNNGNNHPDCYNGESGHLAELSFLVTNDRTAECMIAPIKWIWFECGDNTISSVTGDSLFISRFVYDFNGDPIYDYSSSFPSNFGAISMCENDPGEGKPKPSRCGIDFYNGGIDIVCADSIDARGDINLNDVSNEIADLVLYSNYFIYGIGVFTINEAGQIAASDVNADGLTLSVADLVYLSRIIIGDALAYPKEVVPANINITQHSSGLLSVPDEIQIGAAHLIIEGNSIPTLRADDMDMIFNYDGTNTRVLVYSLKGNSFLGNILEADGEILSIEMADRNGLPIAAKIIPNDYQLMQNYPNPFNPNTTISFFLPNQSDYKLTIFNVNGQKVASFDGSHEAGRVDIKWDAANMASGIYLYRLDVGTSSETKKMVLIK